MPDPDEPRSTEASASEGTDESLKPPDSLLSVVLGGLVGIPIGAVFGAATCLMIGTWDEMHLCVLYGAIAGAVIGSLVMLFEHFVRRVKEQLPIATRVGIVLGLVPATFVVVKAGPGVGLKLLIGAIFVGPAVGLMIGAFFDRAIDEWRNRSQGTSLLFAVLGIVVCSMLIWWIDSSAQSGSEEQIELAVWQVVTESWSQDPAMKNATIDNIVVVREGRRFFAGSFEGRSDDETIRYEFTAQIVGHDVEIEWQSIPE